VGGCLTPVVIRRCFWLFEGHSVLVGGGALLADVGGGNGLSSHGVLLIESPNYLRAPRAVRAQLAEPRIAGDFKGRQTSVFWRDTRSVFISDPHFCAKADDCRGIRVLYGPADSVHEANHFDFHPVKEVAILFLEFLRR